MTVRWMDGFDHYGTIAHMLDGAWAQVNSSYYSLSTANPRTGAKCLRHGGVVPGTNLNRLARRVFGASLQTVATGGVLYLSQLPSVTQSFGIFQFRDITNAPQVTIWLETEGTIKASRGYSNGTLLGASAAPALVASAYQHVECKVHIHDTEGVIEVRVNGVTVLNLTGIDTQSTALQEASQCAYIGYMSSAGNITTGHGTIADLDDVFVWDTAGAQNNDFLGDRRVRAIFPDGDTAFAEWGLTGAAQGFDCINDTTPDDETSYITALPLTGSPVDPVVSEFTLENPPAGVGAIAAIQTYVRMRKTEGGSTNITASLESNGDYSNGSSNPITEVYTYWMDVHELNPNTGTPWTETSLSAAKLRLERTA